MITMHSGQVNEVMAQKHAQKHDYKRVCVYLYKTQNINTQLTWFVPLLCQGCVCSEKLCKVQGFAGKKKKRRKK